ncbi:MAG: hypothetical protein V4732_01760 [Pseudomonadota bacterium]
MNPANHKNLATILGQSFNEMLSSIGKQRELTIKAVDKQLIQPLGFKTVICSIASSSFKLNMLLHFPLDNLAARNFIALIHIDPSKDVQAQYQDYISELTNSLCGSANRILGVCGFSTGMSTPVTLQITNSTLHMNAIAPGSEAHIGCFLNDDPLVFASLYLFINQGFESSLLITVPEFGIATENSGELEFF